MAACNNDCPIDGNRQKDDDLKQVLATLIVLVTIVCLVTGTGMILSDNHGGFLSGVVALMGELLLAAANILVLLLNLLYWRLYGAPRWLRVVIAVQVVPAVVTVIFTGMQGYDSWRQNQAYGQRHRLQTAIRADQASQLAAKQKQCAQRCSGLYSLNAQLIDAADASAVGVARQLVQEGAVVSSKLGRAATTLRTCEGMPLFDLNALEVAVARNSPEMLYVLLPGQRCRRQAEGHVAGRAA